MKTFTQESITQIPESSVPGAPGAHPSSASKEPAKLQDLPDEILLEIFLKTAPTAKELAQLTQAQSTEKLIQWVKQLMQYALVCKRWHYLVLEKYDKRIIKNALQEIPIEKLYELLEKNCKAGSLAGTAILLLDERIDINRQNKYGDTLLHYACGKNWFTKSGDIKNNPNIELAAFLLGKGANPLIADKLGYLPLHVAARCEEDRICGLLLQFTPELQLKYKADENQTPLHVAGSAKVVDILMAHGAEVEGLNVKDKTPLLSAVMSKLVKAEVVASLIKHGANVNCKITIYENLYGSVVEKPVTVLHMAAAYGEREKVKLLVKNGANFKETVRHIQEGNPILVTAKQLAARSYNIKGTVDVVNYLEQVERKSAELSAVKDQVLAEATRLENKFFKEKEKANAVRIALERAWQEVYPQIFEENSSSVELKYLLLNTDKEGMSVTQALAADFSSSPFASLLSFFGDSKDQNQDNSVSLPDKDFTC